MQKKHLNKGFTLIEIVLVLAVIGILASVIVPYFEGIKNESKLTRVEAELALLKNAVENYYLQYSTIPTNNHTALINTPARMINSVLPDPFKTDQSTTPPTYGYEYNQAKKYYILYSKGLDTIAKNWQLVPAGNTYAVDKNPSCHNIIISNLEIRE